MSEIDERKLSVMVERGMNKRTAQLDEARNKRICDRLNRVRNVKIVADDTNKNALDNDMYDAVREELQVQKPVEEIHEKDELISDAYPMTSNKSFDDIVLASMLPDNRKKVSKKKKKKKKEKKVEKKRRQAVETILNDISDNLSEREDKNSSLMAELMKQSERMVIVQKRLYIYSDKDGCFHSCERSDVAMKLRSLLPQELQLKIPPTEYKQAYELLMIMEELTKTDTFFSFNTPFVNCLNGVYDVNRNKLVPHSPSFGFRNCIQANYDPDANCEKFLAYMDYITSGDKELKRLWRVVLGYIWSNYIDAKMAVLIYGIPHTGKSVMCNLIERIVGSEQVSHVDIGMMHRMEFAATTADKILNIVPDLQNDKLKEVGYLKSLISHLDAITVRYLYANPIEVKSRTKMLFATNHLLEFDGSSDTNDIEAVFNRFLYIPYTNPAITPGQDNKNLADELYSERDGIFTWAMKGVQQYLEAGGNFPTAAKSLEVKTLNIQRYCPEQTFCNTFLKSSEGAHASSTAIRREYSKFCTTNYVKRTKKLDILTYIEERFGCTKTKGRVTDEDGNVHNIWYYEDIKLLSDTE